MDGIIIMLCLVGHLTVAWHVYNAADRLWFSGRAWAFYYVLCGPFALAAFAVKYASGEHKHLFKHKVDDAVHEHLNKMPPIRHPEVRVELDSRESNPFAHIGTVGAALEKHGVNMEELAAFNSDTRSVPGHAVVNTLKRWVTVVDTAKL